MIGSLISITLSTLYVVEILQESVPKFENAGLGVGSVRDSVHNFLANFKECE